jgi:hypothetical protein
MSEDAHFSGSNSFAHRFYCADCREYLLADNAATLAARLNHHNISIHPTNFSKWTETTLIGSKFYEGNLPAPPYIAEIASAPIGVKAEIEISKADRKMLDKMHVRWD